MASPQIAQRLSSIPEDTAEASDLASSDPSKDKYPEIQLECVVAVLVICVLGIIAIPFFI